MSRFYVGQRVRIVRAREVFATIGREATVVATDVLVRWSDGLESLAVEVNIDGLRSDHPTGHFGALPENLEPILPAGLESIEDVLRLWVPEGETA